MSISWFITPYDRKYWEDPNDSSEKPTSDLEIDPLSLYRSLSTKWDDVTFYATSKSFHCYDIENRDGTALRIHLYHHNQIIAINNNPTPFFFDFVLLYRAFVPINYKLYFFNSSAWDSLCLTNEIKTNDIRHFMRYQD
jgi:hypothetical protein